MNQAVSNRNVFSGPAWDTSMDMYCRKQVISFRKLGLLICFKFGFQNHFMLLNTLTSTSHFPWPLYLLCWAVLYPVPFTTNGLEGQKYLKGGRVNIWPFDFPLSVILLNFLSPSFFNLPRVSLPLSIMQLEVGCLEWPDHWTPSFNWMFYTCFRAGVEMENSSCVQL